MITSAQVLERAVDNLKYLGGTYGSKIDPTPFLCLVLKLLQIQPQKEIVYLYIEQSDFKYLRALGAFYLRLVGSSKEIYTKLEPLYNDYRKLRMMSPQRVHSVVHMDEFIDNLLREEKVLNISLPRLTKRLTLEENRDLKPYRSELEEQNLIPTQLIEEEIELKRDEELRKRNDYSSSMRKRYNHDDHQTTSRHSNRRLDDRRHDTSHHRSESTRHYSSRNADTSRRRSRSRSPRRQESRTFQPNQRSASARAGRGKFSQAEIDSENAIRFKVGLKPLR